MSRGAVSGRPDANHGPGAGAARVRRRGCGHGLALLSGRLREIALHGKIGPMPLIHTAFYRFIPLPNPEHVAADLRELLSRPLLDGLMGSILVAAEGINGMLAGST